MNVIFFEVLNTNDLAKWVQKECEFTVSSNLNKLEHLVFVVEDGKIAIDDIELFEKCPTEIAIQNNILQRITIQLKNKPQKYFM